MWKTLGTALISVKAPGVLLCAENVLQQQLRTTYVLKRKFAPLLNKKGFKPKTLKSRHYVYELVKNTDVERQPDMDVILTSLVEGVGNVGDRISVRPQYAYKDLLLPGLAVYASPENVDKYEKRDKKEERSYSSAYALITFRKLERTYLSVIMNKETPWTLKPWHVKVSFRKCNFVVPEDTITLPEKPITGPDMNIEGKEFVITVTINNMEKVNVRCRIHHWSTELENRIPYEKLFWQNPTEAILPEQAPILETLPKQSSKKDTEAEEDQ